ncbi:hypothetical protein F7R12_29980 [Pseudomonas tolaasii]|nr:hypothetical protein F7R12_29980 [Pseudomonas tolaasii]
MTFPRTLVCSRPCNSASRRWSRQRSVARPKAKAPRSTRKNPIQCGSWLACDGGVSVTAAIAGKPAPTLTAFTQQGCVLSEFDYE